jgi:hypothetical protein
MKKIILSIGIIGLTFGLKAQENKIESTGNVGIGTINPNSKLEISSSAHDTPILNIISKSFTGGSPDNMFQIRQNSEGDGWLQIGDRYTIVYI